ncbi:hypothetical protein KO465_02985 [Candidatus Micrarchaeota archaeon]|nr:hypothetical protein [Candidatus Micrarchaeota archaeon]
MEKEYEYVAVKNKFWDRCKHQYNSFFSYVELALFSVVGFGLPFIIGHPQWLIGILVNAFLIRFAIHSKFVKTLPLILLPSLGALSAGLLFGVNTMYLIYFIPFIWVSNVIFVLGYKYLIFEKQLNTIITSFVLPLIKAGFLFSVALVMVYMFNFPESFLIAMGGLQFVTAIGGYYLAVGADKVIK